MQKQSCQTPVTTTSSRNVPPGGKRKKACPRHGHVHPSLNPNLNVPPHSRANPHNPAVSGPEIAIGCLDAQLFDASLPACADLDPATAFVYSFDQFASFFGEGVLGGEGRVRERRGELMLMSVVEGDSAGPLAAKGGRRWDERLRWNDRDERAVFRHGYGQDFQLVRVDGLVRQEAFDGLAVKA